MMSKMKEKAGFVSLETIIVTGVVLALGVYGLTQYSGIGELAIEEGLDKVTDVLSFAYPVIGG